MLLCIYEKQMAGILVVFLLKNVGVWFFIILYYAKKAAQNVKKNTKYKYTIRTYKKQRTTT